MRKLMMKMSITIDGFVGGQNGENNWIFKSSTEDSRDHVVKQTEDAGLIIMGRKSFEEMAPYWSTAVGPFAAPMNEIPKAVFTRSGYKGIDPSKINTQQNPTAKSWIDARVFDGDLAEGIMKLKSEEGKPISAIGGAGFMRSLIATGLIDEYHLYTHPVVLGKGMSIFNGVTNPFDLKLIETKSFTGGIVARIYKK